MLIEEANTQLVFFYVSRALRALYVFRSSDTRKTKNNKNILWRNRFSKKAQLKPCELEVYVFPIANTSLLLTRMIYFPQEHLFKQTLKLDCVLQNVRKITLRIEKVICI